MEQSINVLIADDEALIRMDLKEILEESPYFKVIAEAKDGLEAVEAALKHKPDIIFLDIKMPNLDGIEAAQQIREQLDYRVPIIMLTAFSQAELYEKASEAGVFAYLTKPLRKADLAPTIEIATSRAQELDNLSKEISSLKDKLESRKLVEKAKGILMNKEGLDEATAYRKMQKEAMNDRSSLKAVAEKILSA